MINKDQVFAKVEVTININGQQIISVRNDVKQLEEGNDFIAINHALGCTVIKKDYIVLINCTL